MIFCFLTPSEIFANSFAGAAGILVAVIVAAVIAVGLGFFDRW